jgi:hypothetical protein
MKRRRGKVPWLAAGSVLLAACAFATSGDAAAAPAAGKAPWRGSLVALRTEASLLSFDKGAELTYNPLVSLGFDVRPRWWFGDVFYAAADFSLTRELTAADDTTRAGETWLGDLLVGGGAANFWRIPGVGIDLSADVRVIAPTSKLSQARTLQAALRGGVSLARTFPLLSGLTVSYLCQGTGYFHRSTTAETETPLIAGCGGGDDGCDRFRNTGLRNSRFRLANSLSLSMDFLPWLGLDASAVHRLDFLYPGATGDARISYEPLEPTDRRHSMAYEIELRFLPMRSLGIGIGLSSVNPLQAPDSRAYRPFVNRYTTAYVEMRLLIDGLVSQIRRED